MSVAILTPWTILRFIIVFHPDFRAKFREMQKRFSPKPRPFFAHATSCIDQISMKRTLIPGMWIAGQCVYSIDGLPISS